MNAKIIGYLPLDKELLEKDVQKIRGFEFNTGYSDYARGNPGWQNCILWNETRKKDDIVFRGYPGEAQPTELGQQLSYLNAVITDTFYTDHLKWVRIFVLQQGVIIPHRDYLDLPEDEFTRIHIPLQTDRTCLHSEGDVVYHMRKGEIWFIDGTAVHSACCFSETQRLNLCLDFEAGVPFETLFKKKACYVTNLTPEFVERSPVDEAFFQSLQSLGSLINEANFDDIISILAKVHFYKRVNVALMYEWLIDLVSKLGNKRLFQRAIETRRKFLGN